MGPALVSQALLPLLDKGGKKTVVNVSSTVGSVGVGVDYFGKICATYAVSKTALNMLVRPPWVS